MWMKERGVVKLSLCYKHSLLKDVLGIKSHIRDEKRTQTLNSCGCGVKSKSQHKHKQNTSMVEWQCWQPTVASLHIVLIKEEWPLEPVKWCSVSHISISKTKILNWVVGIFDRIELVCVLSCFDCLTLTVTLSSFLSSYPLFSSQRDHQFTSCALYLYLNTTLQLTLCNCYKLFFFVLFYLN